MHPPQNAPTAPEGFWPDLEYIRKRVSIREVGGALGLEVFGSTARCWRLEAHQHGDRSPSLSFTRRNRYKCHVCDPKAGSVLDLVMAFHGFDLREAVEWVTARWYVPQVERGKHVKGREPKFPRVRVGVTGCKLEELVRTGFWATLSKAAQSVLVTILAFSNPDTEWATISFRAIGRYAGLSFNGVDSGVSELEKIGLLEVDRGSKAGVSSDCNRYRLNFDCPAFQESLARIHERHRSKIEFERELQRKRRNALKAKARITLGKPVSPRESVEQIGALMKRA